jgi:hypothetical protein
VSDLPFVGPVANRTVQTQCTNWNAYGLTHIWQMLEYETGRQSWDLVVAWNKMKGHCEHQAGSFEPRRPTRGFVANGYE